MKLEIEIGGKTRSVELRRAGGRLQCVFDGKELEADAVEIGEGVYSILIGAESLEARVERNGARLRVLVRGREYAATIRDPREWRRDCGGALAAEGRQQIVAPMPGKIVRVLARVGDAVEAGQGLLVVEAMKMQNEIRSPKSGTLERLLVSEGQTVSAGEILASVS